MRVTLEIVFLFIALSLFKRMCCEIEPRTSLVFVIDKTESMSSVIRDVYKESLKIFDAVLNSPNSPIDNFVLVYFADPNVYNATITKDPDEFRKALDLNKEDLEDGEDCPELCMAGILNGIHASMYGALVFVFTDASAKDHDKFDEVKRMAQEKYCQITFILLHSHCDRDNKIPERTSVYYELAEITSGQVFSMFPPATPKILKYIKDYISTRNVILYSKKHPPGNHKVEFVVDSKVDDFTLTLTNNLTKPTDTSLVVVGPDNITIDSGIFIDLVNLNQSLAWKLDDVEPGTYSVSFKNYETTSRLLITGKSSVTFRHGFSENIVSSMSDTVSNPIAGSNNHLYIKLYGENVQLKSVKLLNANYHKLAEMLLKLQDKKQQLYFTALFNPPLIPFRIEVKGIDTENGSNFIRFGRILLQKERFIYKRPTVKIINGNNVTIDYNQNLTLECEVEADPEPIIIWKDLNDGREITTVVHPKSPHNFVTTFSSNIYKNTIYECHAENKLGSEKKMVQVYVNPKPYLQIRGLTKKTVDYGAKTVLECIVLSYPLSKVSWQLPKKILRFYKNIILSDDNSTLTIRFMKPGMIGIYSCKIEYNNNQTLWRNVSVTLNAVRPLIKNEALVVEKSVFDGETADLTCSLLQGKPQPEIQWYFKPKLDITAEFRELEEMRNQTTVSLKHLNIYDTGIYACRAKNVLGADKRFFELNVEREPTIKNDINLNATVELYGPVYLKCVVQGIPTPNVTWYKDDQPLDIDGYRIKVFTDHSLSLSNASEDDTGNYKCRAENSRGSAERTITLTVFYLRIEPPEESIITKKVRNRLNLQCKAEGFPEPILYKWIFYGYNKSEPKILRENSEKGRLFYKKVQADQRGSYTCIASNQLTSQNITYHVNVLFGPTILDKDEEFRVVEGDLLLILRCEATGNPTPDITWWADGVPVEKDSFLLAKGHGFDYSNSGDWLAFENITRKQQGKYHCSAKNSVDLATGSTKSIKVESSPPFDQVKNNTKILFDNGSSAKVKCHLHYGLLDWLVWYKDGKVLHFGELTIDIITKSHAGVYTCRVTKRNSPNDIQTTNTTVLVGSEPTFVYEVVTEKEVDFREDISLNCVANGDPNPIVTWKRNGKDITFVGMVYDFSIIPELAGEYSCNVSNEFGHIHRKFNLAFRDCVLKIDSKTDNQPLMITPTGDWPNYETINNYTIIPKNEKLLFICPSKFAMFEQTNIIGRCNGSDIFEIDKRLIEYSKLNCVENIVPKLKGKLRSSIRCLGDETSSRKLVFDIGHKTVNAFEYCMDKHNNVLYAQYVMKSPANFIPKNTDMWDGTKLEEYECEKQQSRFWKLSYFRIKDCCFNKRFLVNPRDMFPGPLQRSVYNELNVASHWSTCHSENMDDMEERVRELSKATKSELIIYTGTAGYWTIRVGDKNITMSIKRNKLIPKYLWKVIQNPVTRSSIAIIHLNIPFISLEEVERYHILCPDICHEVTWMTSSQWKNVDRGYTYCCSLENFMEGFQRQRFDRDFEDWNIFEPYYGVLRYYV